MSSIKFSCDNSIPDSILIPTLRDLNCNNYLNFSNSWISGMEIYEVVKIPTRIPKEEWRDVICTRKN